MKTPGLLATLREMIVHGGLDVATPADAPRMRTVIMTTGVVLVFITEDATGDRALQDRHAHDVETRLAALRTGSIERWRRWVERGGWLASGGLSVYGIVSREDVWALWTAAATSLLAATMRWLMPRILRWVLRRLVRRALEASASPPSTEADDPQRRP